MVYLFCINFTHATYRKIEVKFNIDKESILNELTLAQEEKNTYKKVVG